jgi:hypothetical protein
MKTELEMVEIIMELTGDVPDDLCLVYSGEGSPKDIHNYLVVNWRRGTGILFEDSGENSIALSNLLHQQVPVMDRGRFLFYKILCKRTFSKRKYKLRQWD